jgi:hypothetical protein
VAQRIKGITVTLWDKQQVGVDPLNKPIYEEIPIEVDNVLVTPSTTQEVLESNDLYGCKAIYTLGIPKDDKHDWRNKKITFFGRDFKSFGIPTMGIVENIPLDWDMKVQVAEYA